MSDIKIQPSATGSATVTLTAPATGTARTVTLPDSTGTILDNTSTLDATKLSGAIATSALTVEGTNADLTLAASGNNITFARNSDNYISASGGSSSNLVLDGQNRIVLKHNGTEKLRVTSSGLTFNGDTAAANALDDYEEGTWSPVFKGSTGSAGSWASSTFTSTYTKIGRTVHIACAGYLTNVGSWTGNAIITGLPFASSFGEHSPLSMAGFPNTTTYGTGAGSQPLITCYVGAAGSQINFKSGAGQDPACPYSIVRTGYYVQVSGTYTAT